MVAAAGVIDHVYEGLSNSPADHLRLPAVSLGEALTAPGPAGILVAFRLVTVFGGHIRLPTPGKGRLRQGNENTRRGGAHVLAARQRRPRSETESRDMCTRGLWLRLTLVGAAVVGLVPGTSGCGLVLAFLGDNAGQVTPEPDADGDGVADQDDNCPAAANADQADCDADGIGDVCDRDNAGCRGTWTPHSKLVPDDGAAFSVFGISVALSGDRALIGAHFDDVGATDSGSVYVFENIGGAWVQTAKLAPDDGAARDFFGTSVALAGDRALIGANGDDDNGEDSGSAYVFDKVGDDWVQTAKLLPGDGAADDRFGTSVALRGERALIGAPQHDENGPNAGSAYVFEEVGGAWEQTAEIMAADGVADDSFGISVALSDERALIGATRDDTDNGVNSGSAYLFGIVGGAWVQQAKLLPSDGAPSDGFGTSVALSGERALVGTPFADASAPDSGSAYFFRNVGGVWIEAARIVPDDGAEDDEFGRSVAVSGDRALIGANRAAANGVNTGVGYVFTRLGGVWTQTARLTPRAGVADGHFGWSVALSGDRALIAVPLDDAIAPGSGSAHVFAFTPQP